MSIKSRIDEGIVMEISNWLAELTLLDMAASRLIHRPGHTLSYDIGIEALAGNPLGLKLKELIDAIVPGHIEKAVAYESTDAWKAAIEEVE
jgi:hypothetical protein